MQGDVGISQFALVRYLRMEERKMNYVLVFVYAAFTSLIVSFFVSMIIGNTVGIHYLNKHDKDWQNMLNRILDDLKKHTRV